MNYESGSKSDSESESLLSKKIYYKKNRILGKYKQHFYPCKIIDLVDTNKYLVEFIKSKYRCYLTNDELIKQIKN